MAQYTVKHNQNIFDVAVELYGTIEGIFDLMITNQSLGFASTLQPGTILEYHEFYKPNLNMANQIKTKAVHLANGEQTIYPKTRPNKELIMHCMVPPECNSLILGIIGNGELNIDWGDNSDIQTIDLDYTDLKIQHCFDNIVSERRVKLYGDVQLDKLDLSAFEAEVFCTFPLNVTQVIENTNTKFLEHCLLFQNTAYIDLSGLHISDLTPISHMHLQELKLNNVEFSSHQVLENYLWEIINNYDERPGCTVHLTGVVSENAKTAMRILVGEPEFNAIRNWKFFIDGETYPHYRSFSNDFSNDFGI